MEPGDSNLARNECDILGAEKNGITAICREKCVELMARWYTSVAIATWEATGPSP